MKPFETSYKNLFVIDRPERFNKKQLVERSLDGPPILPCSLPEQNLKLRYFEEHHVHVRKIQLNDPNLGRSRHWRRRDCRRQTANHGLGHQPRLFGSCAWSAYHLQSIKRGKLIGGGTEGVQAGRATTTIASKWPPTNPQNNFAHVFRPPWTSPDPLSIP